ncbi:OmpA family protein [Spirosoma koreense]
MQVTDPESCFHLEGKVIDYKTHEPLNKADLFAKLPTGLRKVSVSKYNGQFLASIPCEAKAIIIERTGYRRQILTLHYPDNHLPTRRVTTLIPLVTVDHQDRDKTYLQTEQTEYVQQISDPKSDKNTKLLQHGIFTITDAVRQTPQQAHVCFYFTKNSEKKCIETDYKGQLKLDFNQADIIAVEVEAAGYQTYKGNLLVEKLDGRTVKHNIGLQRELTIISIQDDKATSCELIGQNKTVSIASVQGRSGWFSSFDVSPGNYELVVKQTKQTIRQTVKLYDGLNYKLFVPLKSDSAITSGNVTRVSVPPNKRPASRLLLPDSIPVIYFEQGSYQLRSDSQEVLREVAHYLKNNRHYLIEIAGHTDNVGNERLNRSLSEFRANVTAIFLTRQGIDESKVTKLGYGSQYPISPNDTEANKALNRRVSLKLIATQ